MDLSTEEKQILNTLFKDIKGTTRNEMLCMLYAAKPANDGTLDSPAIIGSINGLILKIFHAEQPEMEAVFAQIPFQLEG
ncbi:hypothetical protein [Eubacterium aggregans]|uniref:hypothetical protein n=1 Tax=Eubacterium aggregans TaxID=81409 RepID=UPI003F337354